MTFQQAQVLIIEGVNTLGTFYTQDLLPEQIDLEVNKVINLLIRNAFNREQIRGYGLEDVQLRLDDFNNLMVKDQEFTVTNISTNVGKAGVFMTLPDNYLHLINDRSNILYNCNGKTVPAIVPNRLTETEQLYNTLNNSIYRTRKNSPVSNLQGKILYVYTNPTFKVKTIFIDYLKAPVISDVVNNPNGIFDFNDDFCYVIVESVIKKLCITAQQSPQKIGELTQENIR